MEEWIVETKGLKKYYKLGDNTVKALDGVDFRVKEQEFVVIIGKSGSGKSTLLHMVGGLDPPTEGDVIVAGRSLNGLTKEELAIFRRRKVGFIFQNYNLIDYMTPIENVKLTAKQDALPILKQLGLTEDEAKRNVMKLSGGQQQRVAIARTLVSNAPVILADEPTGNLDKDTAAEITGILKNCAHQMNKCVIIVTHSNDLVKQADTVFKLKKGRLLQI